MGITADGKLATAMNDNPNATAARSQCAQIRALLEAGARLTPADARAQCGCDRLGARIYDLKREGLNIIRDWHRTPNGKRVASYRLFKLSGENCS